MLRAVVEINERKAYIDFNGSWDKIHNSLSRIGLQKPMMEICLNDPNIKFHVTKTSGTIYDSISNLITHNDTMFYIYKACMIAQIALKDSDLLGYLQNKLDTNEIDRLSKFDMYHQLFNYHKNMATEKVEWDYNASNQDYQLLKLFNKPVLFTSSRIDKTTLPKGLYLYEVRHDDDQRGVMATLRNRIIVNFWGTILSTKKIPLDKYGSRIIDEEKNVVFSSVNMKLEEYINKFPLQKDKVR
ncbi:MAG: LPD28 domain-containing protein [Bacilli bacterium]